MKHIKNVSVAKAQNGCNIDDIESIVSGLQSEDPLACLADLLLATLEGDKDKGDGTTA